MKQLLVSVTVLLVIFTVIPACVTNAKPDYSYSFVHRSDTQGVLYYPALYNLTFMEIESLKSQYNISAIFITGDITDAGPHDYPRYAQTITLTTIPIYEVSGNHDLYNTYSNYTQWDTYVPDGSGKHNYGFVFNDFVVYGFGWHGMDELDPKAETAMEDLFAAHPTKVPLILTHAYFRAYEGDVTGERDDVAYDILDSLTRNAVILSGHTHTDTQLGFMRQTRYRNITVIEDFVNPQDWKKYSVGRLYTVTTNGSYVKNMTVSDVYLNPDFVVNNTVPYTLFPPLPPPTVTVTHQTTPQQLPPPPTLTYQKEPILEPLPGY